MMAERMKRGLKAEMEEAREILDAYVEENRALVDLLAKGRGHVQELQEAAAAFQPEDPNEAAMAHVRGLAYSVRLMCASTGAWLDQSNDAMRLLRRV